jgi:hypothetical protein
LAVAADATVDDAAAAADTAAADAMAVAVADTMAAEKIRQCGLSLHSCSRLSLRRIFLSRLY